MLSLEEIDRFEQKMRQGWTILEKGGQVGPINLGDKPSQEPLTLEELVLLEEKSRLKSKRLIRVPTPTFERDNILLVVKPVVLAYLGDLDVYAKILRAERTTVNGTQVRTVSFPRPMRVTQNPDGIWLPQEGRNNRTKHYSLEKAQPFLDPWKLFSGYQADRKFLKSLGMKPVVGTF